MPLVDPQVVSNPTTGQVATAAWGDAVRDAIVYIGGGFPHCSLVNSVAQSIPNTTYTSLTTNQENSDIGGMHSTSSNTDRVVVPAGEAGLYAATGTVSFAANATSNRFTGFGKNAASPTYSCMGVLAADATGGTSLTGAASFVLVAGDYLKLMVSQISGGSLNCTMNDFSVRWVATA